MFIAQSKPHLILNLHISITASHKTERTLKFKINNKKLNTAK